MLTEHSKTKRGNPMTPFHKTAEKGHTTKARESSLILVKGQGVGLDGRTAETPEAFQGEGYFNFSDCCVGVTWMPKLILFIF